MRRLWWAAAFVVVAVLLAAVGVASVSDTAVTAARFSTLRADATALRAFLQHMPKGADLHVHLSGAVYAERLIAWAAQDGLCVRTSDVRIVEPPCDAAKGSPAVGDALQDQGLYDRIVNALSMRFFRPSAGTPSGHDQFFVTFDRFGGATSRRVAEMTIEMLARYDADAVQYAEFMVTFTDRQQRQDLARAVGDERNLAAALEKIKRSGLNAAVATARAQVAATIAKINTLRPCDAANTQAGCKVKFRYIAQVNRNSAWADVFVQTAIAAELARTEPWVVGLNFVGPEDYRPAREDYADHMRMIGLLAQGAPVALHAGELWLGLVPLGDLTFHIGDAVTVAGARRIGHGVSLSFEPRMDELLAAMRARNVAVEINLTSNDVILGVRGKSHPLPAYLKAGVSVVLSTDDAGVSRIDLTNEYVRAARDYGLSYRRLKAIARNALTHAFLNEQDKRDELARFDRDSAAFEREIAARGSVLGNIGAVIAAMGQAE